MSPASVLDLALEFVLEGQNQELNPSVRGWGCVGIVYFSVDPPSRVFEIDNHDAAFDFLLPVTTALPSRRTGAKTTHTAAPLHVVQAPATVSLLVVGRVGRRYQIV